VRIRSWQDFRGVKQDRDSDDCVLACISTVLLNLKEKRVSIEEVRRGTRNSKGGYYSSDAGIYLQNAGFNTELELLKWRRHFRPETFPSHSRRHLKTKLAKLSTRIGTHRQERYLRYLDVGGKMKFGGTLEGVIRRLQRGGLAIFMVNRYAMEEHRDKSKKPHHAAVAFVPEARASTNPLYIGKNHSSLINLNHFPSPPPKDK